MKVMTSLLWYILWSFCASLNIYVTHRGQLKCLVMFSFWWNVTSNWAQMFIIVILLVMSAASKLVDIASKLDWYSEAKTAAEMLVLNLEIEKIHLQTNALMTYMFTNTELCYNEWMVLSLQFKVVCSRGNLICRESANLAHLHFNNFESL